jgi:hypothetical protein
MKALVDIFGPGSGLRHSRLESAVSYSLDVNGETPVRGTSFPTSTLQPSCFSIARGPCTPKIGISENSRRSVSAIRSFEFVA